MTDLESRFAADLHTHSSCSDGALSPEDLVARAVERGLDLLAITDHDTVSAFHSLDRSRRDIRLVAGIEFSTTWEAAGIHVLGLNIDPGDSGISDGVRAQTAARQRRARQIDVNLEKLGLQGTLEGARSLAAGGFIGRPDFARHLVAAGHVKTEAEAFKRFLGDGKAGDVREHWADLHTVIGWIRSAGGIAVLAHPLKYRFTRTRLRRLLEEFRAAGGEGLEVISGQQTPKQTRTLGQACREMKLLASAGSDFHRPETPWAELGAVAPLPERLTPVWERF